MTLMRLIANKYLNRLTALIIMYPCNCIYMYLLCTWRTTVVNWWSVCNRSVCVHSQRFGPECVWETEQGRDTKRQSESRELHWVRQSAEKAAYGYALLVEAQSLKIEKNNICKYWNCYCVPGWRYHGSLLQDFTSRNTAFTNGVFGLMSMKWSGI